MVEAICSLATGLLGRTALGAKKNKVVEAIALLVSVNRTATKEVFG